MNRPVDQSPIEDESWADDFVARNREALNASIAQARSDIAAGQFSTRSVEDVIAEGRRRRAKKA